MPIISAMTETATAAPLAAGAMVPVALSGDTYKYDLGELARRQISVDDYGAVGDGTTTDTTAVQTALTATSGGVLRFTPGKTYKVGSGLVLSGSDVTIDARGATITSASTTLEAVLAVSGNRVKIIGGIWKLTAAHDNPWFFNFTGTNCELDGARLVKDPVAGHYHFYVRYTADGFIMRDCRTEGSNGFYIEASNVGCFNNHLVARATGGDDCFVLKAISDNCRNFRAEGNYIENYAAGLSVGSEIGVLGANDSTYSRTAGQFVFANNTLVNCSTIALIKPGGVAGADYRDGTAEDGVISNNTLLDLTGAKFERGIAITPGRGARVRRIYGWGNVVRARSIGGSGRLVGALDIFIINTAGGTTEADVSGVNLQVDFYDIYDGDTNHASRPGYPCTYVVAVSNETAATGTMSDIALDIRGHGSSEAGAFVGSGLDDAVTFRRLDLTKVNRTTAAQAGAYLLSRVAIEDATIQQESGNAYNLSTTGEIVSQMDQLYWIDQVTAGNADSQAPWFARKRCYVTKIEVTTNLAVTQSDANYSTFTLYNAADAFHLPTTKVTTGGASAPALNITANALVTMLESRTVSDATNQGRCFFAKDARLQIDKAETGTGATIRAARLRIHWAPY